MPVNRSRKSFKIGAPHRGSYSVGEVMLKHDTKQNDLLEHHDPFRDHPIRK